MDGYATVSEQGRRHRGGGGGAGTLPIIIQIL